MKRRFFFLFPFAAIVPYSACYNQDLAQKHAHRHLRALSDVGFIRSVIKQASLVKFHKNLPSYSMASSKQAVDSGETLTIYYFVWSGETEGGSCPPTDPAPTARCGGQGTIEIMDGSAAANHDCAIDVTDPALMICAPQNEGLVFVACVGEAAVDRELSVTLPADTAVCDGDFETDEYPGYAFQGILLATWCGDQWVSNGDICSAESFTLDTGEMVCVAEDDCGDSTCTASLSQVTVTSTGQDQAECTYPLTNPPTEDDPTSPPSTSSSCDPIIDELLVCIDYELDLSVAMNCTTCVENARGYFSGGISCDEIEPWACSALSCICGSCNDYLQTTIDCIGDERGCQFFECGRTDGDPIGIDEASTSSVGASTRSYPSILLDLISLLCMY